LITDVKQLDLKGLDALATYSIIRQKFPGQSFLLESVDGSRRTARYSFIGFQPLFDFVSKGNEVRMNGESSQQNDPYEYLRETFNRFRTGTVDFLPFSGGMVGYLSYDMVRFFERLPEGTGDDLELPDSHLMVPTYMICFDYINDRRYLVSHGPDPGIEKILRQGIAKEGILKIGRRTNNMDRVGFMDSVDRAKEYIRTGDIFQTVLSRRTEVEYQGDEFQMYRVLRDINPSPYMFFLDFDETKIVGSSPEMLMRLEDGVLTTRPLAGTRPRDRDPEQDEKLKIEMLLDEKERAEHVMLVDLHRNDMGSVSEYGSVKVTELMGVEKYSHVQHLVSNVVSRLRDDKDGFDALRACFPAGTVSGAPKIRAMEIIDELEPDRRGPYAGVVGYFDFSGNSNFAINIRTIFTKGDKAYVQAGAGIVADSIPENEFIETENKMGAMIRALEVGTYG
jgi:anthranilate synthase component 1